MPREDKWHARAVCPKCDWSIYAPFGDVFHVHVSCCPECGYEKYDGRACLSRLYRNIQEWRVRTMRWVSTAKLTKPSTWRTGYWETLDSLEGREDSAASKEST